MPGFLLGISKSGGQFVLSEATPGIHPVEGGSALTGGGAGTDTRVGKSGSSPVRGAPTLKPDGAAGGCAPGDWAAGSWASGIQPGGACGLREPWALLSLLGGELFSSFFG